MDGKSLDRLVAGLIRTNKRGSFYSVLFYAKWCPFSSNFRPMFDALSSMFPQVTHLALEESTATPRYYCLPYYLLLVVSNVEVSFGLSALGKVKDVLFYQHSKRTDPLAWINAIDSLVMT